MSYKFIIDTSVLDNKSVAKLRDAGLIEACNSRRFAFYVTPILLKETLHFSGSGKIPLKAVDSVRLLVDLRWQRLFNGFGGVDGIFAKELEGKTNQKCLFIKHEAYKENLKLFLEGGEFDDDTKKTLSDDQCKWAEKKNNNREIYKEMRQCITKKLREDKSISRKGADFSKVLNLKFESAAVDKINNKINFRCFNDQFAKDWVAHKERCPYFNKYVESDLFISFYFMTCEQEPRIDKNAQDDIEHLLYLVGIDGIVSNEKGFIKDACKKLFSNKDFLSVDDFVLRLKSG